MVYFIIPVRPRIKKLGDSSQGRPVFGCGPVHDQAERELHVSHGVGGNMSFLSASGWKPWQEIAVHSVWLYVWRCIRIDHDTLILFPWCVVGDKCAKVKLHEGTGTPMSSRLRGMAAQYPSHTHTHTHTHTHSLSLSLSCTHIHTQAQTL